MQGPPLLSICIPTYNRAQYLYETLNSITRQDIFKETYDVEIVISDNCSEDNTEEIANKYIERFGSKIRYFRNRINIKDKNYEQVLSKGNGIFLKLNNDTLTHGDGSLALMLDTIKNNNKDRRILFFLNQALNKQNSFICNDLNEFVEKISYYSTWIASFGMWKADFDSVDDFSRYSGLLLTQTDVLMRTIGNSRSVFVNNELLFNPLEVSSKGGYDTITIFLDNYTRILRESVSLSYLRKKIYKRETKKLLIDFILPSLVKIAVYPEKYRFPCKSKFTRIIKFYRRNPFILGKFFLKYYILIFYTRFKIGRL